nr:RNA polymerase factor sigma-54 [Clostridium sp. CM74B_53]
MELKAGISLQTKQVLSQMQVESLNILAMSMTELKDFMQNEEIENPLVEFMAGRGEEAAPVTYNETERFYNGTEREDSRENELYEIEDSEKSIEDLVNMQLHWKRIGETEHKIVDFCIQSLEQSGYLLIPAQEIAKRLNVPEKQVENVLAMLKELEPQGLFASGLEECLLIQVRGMDEEETLSLLIKNHLQDIAEGKISTISRALKLSSADVRKMIHIIKELNPRPLNGIGGEKAQYILPDVLLSNQAGQWNIELNDKWTGNLQINDYYIHMMETAQDQELKSYFENKLRRARFIINAVEQRRETLTGITREILKRQQPYFLGTGQLKPMTLEEIADALEIHKSTVSRAIRDKYLRAPSGCFLFRSLFTTGIPSGDGNGDVSRNAVKAKLKEFVSVEDRKKPWSDEQLAGLLQDAGMPISRRTVAKYRMELGIGGAFQRKDG